MENETRFSWLDSDFQAFSGRPGAAEESSLKNPLEVLLLEDGLSAVWMPHGGLTKESKLGCWGPGNQKPPTYRFCRLRMTYMVLSSVNKKFLEMWFYFKINLLGGNQQCIIAKMPPEKCWRLIKTVANMVKRKSRPWRINTENQCLKIQLGQQGIFLSLLLTKAALWKCSLWQLVRSCDGQAAPWLYSFEANRMMAVLYGKITDMFICTSIVLRMLTGSAKQDHVQYELLGISCSKIIFKKV